MGIQTEAFHNDMIKAILPKLRWTEQDKRFLWQIPFSQWGDYFSLRKAKHKMMKMYARRQTMQKMPQLVPLYINAIQKGHVLTMDYLQNYGDLILKRFVQNHFRRKYGFNSKEWQTFLDKEEKLWQKVSNVRQHRQEAFLKQRIMELEKIPKNIRNRIVKNNEKNRLRRSLEAYYHYLDGEDRLGQKLPDWKKPTPTSLVILQNPPQKKPSKEKKPLPPISIWRSKDR